MKNHSFKRFLSLVMLAAMILTFCAACSKGRDGNEQAVSKAFTVIAVDPETKAETTIPCNSDVKMLGDCLIQLGIIEGENGQYGLYVTKVNGKNTPEGNYYWAFYINDCYAMTGVSDTEIQEGDTYKFVVESY